jgi:PAS domain S-box-containing protein
MPTTKNSKNARNREAPDSPNVPDDVLYRVNASGGGPPHTPLHPSAEILQKALRSSPDSITISRLSDGRIIDVNGQFERTTGYARVETMGKTSLELGLWKDPDDRSELERILDRDGAVRDFESAFVTKDGDVRQCVMSAEKIEIGGEQCMLATVRDVTDSKRAETALRWLNERLQSERQSVVEKEAALKQVLGYLEQEKSAIRNEIASQINHLFEPVIAKLRHQGGRMEQEDVDRLERKLKRLVDEQADDVQDGFSKLTVREMEICAAIKRGLSSKEIAEELGVSVNTVHKHRQVIRRKLRLNTRDSNLAVFLRFRN